MAQAVDGPDTHAPATILIVEDEILTRMVLAEHLRDCGYRVLEAGTAAEAIVILQSDHAVDILFTDVGLPGEMNGFGLCAWARRYRAGIRLIVTSGLDKAAHEASELCAEEPYLAKPYDPEHLMREIERQLARNG